VGRVGAQTEEDGKDARAQESEGCGETQAGCVPSEAGHRLGPPSSFQSIEG
jgi:hypothetical protein